METMKEYSIDVEGYLVPRTSIHSIDDDYSMYRGMRWDLWPVCTIETRLKDICDRAGIQFMSKKYVHMRFVHESSDDIERIGVICSNMTERVLGKPECGEIPYELVKDCKEGDILTFTAPMIILSTNECALLHVNALLWQRKYDRESAKDFAQALSTIRANSQLRRRY